MALETLIGRALPLHKVERMKKVSKYILVSCLVILVVSCLKPNSKEAYLEKFERFINRVETNHKKYTKKDWEWTDSQFKKYNGGWYLKFSDEFTLSDQIKIKSLIIRYYSYRNKDDVSEVLTQLFKEDVDELRNTLKEYIENDMDDDLEKLIDGAASIGDSAVKVLEDIIKELEKPGVDPRAKAKAFSFDKNLKAITDLRTGQILPGIVNNITNFGCFVDIGIKESGLIHISNLADTFVKDVNEHVSLHQQIVVKVLEVDVARKRIQLAMHKKM